PHLLKLNRDFYLAGQIIETIRVANAGVRHELNIFTTEGVSRTRTEIGEAHAACAADAHVSVMRCRSEAIGRQPFHLRCRIEEGAIDAFRVGSENAVQGNCARHGVSPFEKMCSKKSVFAS